MKKSLAALLGLCLMWVLSPVGWAATVSIVVNSDSQVRGPALTLGDIATVSGDPAARVKALRELKLGDAPDPGTTVFMTPESLEPRLAANRIDFSEISWEVPAQFKISTLSQPVSGAKIAEVANAFLTQTAMRSTINRVDLPADIQAPLGKLELVPELSGGIRYNGVTTVNVAIRADGRSFLKTPVRFEIRRYQEVVVAAINLNAGDILTEQSVRLERLDTGSMPAGYLTETGKAVGLQVRYPMPPGSVLSERSVTRPILVRRGELVRILARIGEIEIYANGVSYSQGAVGDLIRVQNTTTKKILTGRVQADKTVLVLNQPGG